MQLHYNSKTINDPRVISEKLNEYFIDTINNVLNTDSKNAMKTSQYDLNTCPSSMFAPPITETEIINSINELKGKFSSGFDEIPVVLLKHCSYLILKPLTHIFNLSLKLGIYPDQLKISKIRPLFKKGEKHDIKNYRPLALLPAFPKVLEKIMYNRLISFVKKFDILTVE